MTEEEVQTTSTTLVVPEEEALPVAEEAPKGTLAMFATDEKAEQGGVWFSDPATGVELLIAHGDNPNYRDYLQTLIRPYISLINSNTAKGYQFMRRMEAKAMAKFVLLGWRHLTGEDGQPIEYSPEQALKLLTQPKWRKFRRLVDAFKDDDNAFGLDRETWGEA